MNDYRSTIFRILVLIAIALCWASCRMKSGKLDPLSSPASDNLAKDKSDLSNAKKNEFPFVLDIRPDSVKPSSQKIKLHIEEIQNFLDMITKDHLSLEDYKRHFSIHNEYEEICFYSLCCDLTREPAQSGCREIYKQRIQAQARYGSFFLGMLKGKLFQQLRYTNSKEVEIRFVNATYYNEIKFQSAPKKALSTCTYELKDRNGGKIYIIINAVSGEPATIERIGDKNGVSILGFVEKPPCKH